MKKLRKEIDFAINDHLNERTVYSIGSLTLMLGHVIYLAIFLVLNVWPMVWFNLFSVPFYAVMFVINLKKTNYTQILMLETFEIMLHALAGMYFMGWEAGFMIFYVCDATIPFFGGFRKKAIPLIISFTNIGLFVLLRHTMYDWAAPFHINDPGIMKALYLYNALAAFLIAVYISSYYIFIKEKMTANMRRKNEHLQKLATIDPLTELFNRRAMMEYIKLIEKKAHTEHINYNICIADIDDFKKINDTYGHDAGDEVLRVISKIFVDVVPTEGYVCRWGGEEIMFALPPSDSDMAIFVAEKVRMKIAEQEFELDGQKIHVTMTFGVCRVRPDENYDSGISRADKRLYEGKRTGKNKVVAV